MDLESSSGCETSYLEPVPDWHCVRVRIILIILSEKCYDELTETCFERFTKTSYTTQNTVSEVARKLHTRYSIVLVTTHTV